jgi:hypothetical protein
MSCFEKRINTYLRKYLVDYVLTMYLYMYFCICVCMYVLYMCICVCVCVDDGWMGGWLHASIHASHASYVCKMNQ